MIGPTEAQTIVTQVRAGKQVIVVTGDRMNALGSPEFLNIVVATQSKNLDQPERNTLLAHGHGSLLDNVSGGSVHVVSASKLGDWARGRTADEIWIDNVPTGEDAEDAIRLMAAPRKATIHRISL